MKRFLAIVAIIVGTSPIFAACHAVSVSGAGAKTGADWNNSLAGIPATLVRGDIYYLADGTYPSFTFNQSGTTTVEVRKAQSYDFGSTGCTSSIGAGWNPATMGAGQAVFATYRQWALNSTGLIINGNGQQTTAGCGGNVGSNPAVSPATPTDCGIKVDNTACAGTSANSCSDGISDGGVLSGGFTLEYVEILGVGNATSENYMIRADNSTGTIINHIYMHHYGSVCIVAGGTSGIILENSYFFRNQIVAGSSPAHGQCFEVGASSSNGTAKNNIYRDLGGTAIMATFNATGTSSGWNFYNNSIWNTVGFTPLFASTDGIIDCINSHTCNSLTVSQNSIAGMTNNVNVENQVGGSITTQNNLFYLNDANPPMTGSGTYTQDHNSFLSSGASCAAGTANVCDNASANPFVSWTTGNFNLANDAADWNNRASLGSPFTLDANGVSFTTDRGAFQFVSSTTVSTPTASVGTGTYVGSQHPAYTSSTAGASLCLTTDGSTPTAASGLCTHGTPLANGSSVPIFNTGAVINVIGIMSGATNSSVATFTYTLTATTWYVRADGGTIQQCTGHTDAAYPGSGVNQACGLNDMRWMYDNQTNNNWQANGTSWIMASGDTLILESAAAITAVPGKIAASAGPYNRIGWDFGGSCSGAGCGAGFTWCLGVGQCGIPPPPAGTVSNPTHIWGANHGSCSTSINLPGSFVSTTVPNNASVFEVYGDFGLNTTWDLSGTHDVDIQCVGITTHGDCMIHISPNPIPCSTSVPLSSYASEGLRSSTTTGTGIALTDVWIHGFQDSGWIGPIDGAVSMTDVRFSYDVEAGFNMDNGTDPQSGGTITTSGLTLDFNGCNQSWPFTNPVPIDYCSDQNSAGDGDGLATPSSSFDTFVNDHTTSAYNTQDGYDVGHNQDPGSVSWNHSIMYGNMGGTFKAGGMSATMRNSVSIQNCYRMAAAITGVPSTFNSELSLYCRAGDGVGVNWLGGGSGEVIAIQDNSIITYGNDAIDFQIQGTGTCTGCTMLTEGNVFLAYSNPSTGLSHNPVMYGNMSPTTSDHNTIFNFFGYTCTGTDQCLDPLFVGEPPPATPVGNNGLDAFNFNLSSSSPSIASQVPISGITDDFFGVTRLTPTSAGAAQFVSGVLNINTVSFGPTNSHGITQSH